MTARPEVTAAATCLTLPHLQTSGRMPAGTSQETAELPAAAHQQSPTAADDGPAPVTARPQRVTTVAPARRLVPHSRPPRVTTVAPARRLGPHSRPPPAITVAPVRQLMLNGPPLQATTVAPVRHLVLYDQPLLATTVALVRRLVPPA